MTMTKDDVPREITGPVKYVWVEVHEIGLYEETTTPERGIGIANWPVLTELREQIESARDTPRCSAIMMRKDEWERRMEKANAV